MSSLRLSKWMLVAVAMAGLSSVAAAQDRYGRYYQRDGRSDFREDARDLRYDYAKVDRLRADLARDQWRLEAAWRSGRRWEAEQIRRDMARDQARLEFLLRDIRHDRRDIDHDRWERGYR